mmetsp:Transcript_23560/g.55843  ORF Transcript_23560/g.55843 Transcript_23560/m.55843 type:complete len:273 (-) Transcript_23560:1279-2097(-)
MHLRLRLIHCSRMALMRFLSCKGVGFLGFDFAWKGLLRWSSALAPPRPPRFPRCDPSTGLPRSPAPPPPFEEIRPRIASSRVERSSTSSWVVWQSTESRSFEGVASTASISRTTLLWCCWRVARSRRISRISLASGNRIQSMAQSFLSRHSWLAQYSSLVRLPDRNSFLITHCLSMRLRRQKLTDASLAVFPMSWTSSLSEYGRQERNIFWRSSCSNVARFFFFFGGGFVVVGSPPVTGERPVAFEVPFVLRLAVVVPFALVLEAALSIVFS